MPRTAIRSRFFVRTLVLVAAFAGADALADIVTFTPTRDNTLFEDPTGTLSNGSGPSMFAGVTASFGVRRSLVAFKLQGFIPADAIITRAEVTLYCERARGSAVSMGLHAMESSWGEGTSFTGLGGGVQAERGDATWLSRFYGSGPEWRTAGGDFVATASAVAAVGSSGRSYTWSGAGLIADVRRWVADAESNHGWILKAESEIPTREAKRFSSREASNESRRPRLLVEFTRVPSPGSAGAGVLGLLLASRRRRA